MLVLNCFLQMTKTIKKLEKERNTWKSKCESSNHSLVQMVDEVSEVIHFYPSKLVHSQGVLMSANNSRPYDNVLLKFANVRRIIQIKNPRLSF